MPYAEAEANVDSALAELVARCNFLHLTDSQSYYPNSKGTGLPLIRVETPLCSAVIAFQGAHLLEFQPAEGKPLLWLSPNCNFTAGTALRGGVPICLPWFGPHETDPGKPKHGFARNRNWALRDAQLLDKGAVQLTFSFTHTPDELFAYAFDAELIMTLGKSAKLKLNIINRALTPIKTSWALHSYFPVKQLNQVAIKGLGGRDYLDNLDKHAQKFQAAEVIFDSEVDRVFPAIDNSLSVESSPRIHITHSNCPSVIVWNPGAENAAKIADIGAGNEQGYVCVERGAVLAESWVIEPSDSKCGWVEFAEFSNL